MMKVRAVESLALVVGMVAAEAMGSGVGVSYYQPSTPVPAGPVASGPTGAPIAGCSTCKRLGFACVDHATPPPCSPEGGCSPAGPYGFAQPHWRRWPGTDDGGPTPPEATTEGSLIPPYEPPSPEDEDKQAPPSLDDTTSADVESNTERDATGSEMGRPEMNRPEMNRPGMDITLPPLPRPSLPTPGAGGEAAPANEGAPPSLPFGYAPPAGGTDAFGPPAPAFEKTVPASLPKSAAGKRDLPPPLPVGFTQNGVAPAPRRLPTTFGRPAAETPLFDAAIQPASANLPITR
ncbi:hypothetical protein [Botrimarina mediterranea]|uniref:Uncharacterized protein n=1 Tax=Botrimarina mediterranea TaxID=2528022 RepID=A0A518K3J0_9BACT|nr:hypothetical protein [Botrimarina mediterranea]QDV72371.1 hypothetical protein Spa11_05450 [Botrimarina mediterranea]QDV76917.1 hypothetical protein K2D_05000 [Planctomycetes bacterium K2D]